jgi:ABC-type transport system involved in multi-copper enzyme maturation permease subunit
MTILWPIALITLKEGIRNRAFYGITIIALMLSIANFLICSMIMQEVGKVAVDIALSTISFSGLLIVFFVGINLMAKDLDKRTIYMLLSRPISRSQYIIGKFAGMILLIVSAVLCVSIIAMLSVLVIKMSYPGYFPRFSWSMVLLAISFITLSLVLLSALSFLFASFTTSSFISLVLTMIAYFIGQSVGDVKTLVEAPEVAGLHTSTLTVKLVQAAYYLFPNLSIFDIKTQAAHAIPLSLSYILWATVYGLFYTALVISGAALIFRRRELP